MLPDLNNMKSLMTLGRKLEKNPDVIDPSNYPDRHLAWIGITLYIPALEGRSKVRR